MTAWKTDAEALASMLERAQAMQPYQELEVRIPGGWPPRVIVSTGPDDAAAVFQFTVLGELEFISIVESYPDLEAP